ATVARALVPGSGLDPVAVEDRRPFQDLRRADLFTDIAVRIERHPHVVDDAFLDELAEVQELARMRRVGVAVSGSERAVEELRVVRAPVEPGGVRSPRIERARLQLPGAGNRMIPEVDDLVDLV